MQELEKIFKVLCLTGLKGIKQSENVFELNKTIILEVQMLPTINLVSFFRGTQRGNK